MIGCCAECTSHCATAESIRKFGLGPAHSDGSAEHFQADQPIRIVW